MMSNKRQGFVDHPSVVDEKLQTHIDKDGSVRFVLVVYTTLRMSHLEPGFDKAEWERLVTAVRVGMSNADAYNASIEAV